MQPAILAGNMLVANGASDEAQYRGWTWKVHAVEGTWERPMGTYPYL